MSEAIIALTYKGGAYIHGVPARDLTADEAAQYADIIKQQEELTGMKLYEPVKAKAVKSAEGKAE